MLSCLAILLTLFLLSAVPGLGTIFIKLDRLFVEGGNLSLTSRLLVMVVVGVGVGVGVLMGMVLLLMMLGVMR